MAAKFDADEDGETHDAVVAGIGAHGAVAGF